MDFQKGLQKIVSIFEQEGIDYMVVGGFAMSYYNRFRYTADIDCVLQIYASHVKKIVKYFPDWMPSLDFFEESTSRGMLFNITDFETGVKYDFMPYVDSDYNWTAFKRRKKVDFMGVECYISAPEDLIISKLKWYAISPSAKQLEDVKFLLKSVDLNANYLESWCNNQLINRHGLF